MDVHERLTEAVRLVKEKEKWLHRREITGNLIQEQKNLRDQLKRQLAFESRDVEKLDGVTLLNLWHSLRGTKEEAKRKEQEQYLTAKLKYDEANAALIAIEASEKVEKAFFKVQNSLGSAQGWGAFDLLGGGLLSTAIKHSRISDARNEIDQAQLLLRKFQR